jgi:hypothetical protein
MKCFPPTPTKRGVQFFKGHFKTSSIFDKGPKKPLLKVSVKGDGVSLKLICELYLIF